MMVLPPVAGVNAGRSTGGGLIDTFKQMVSGATSTGGTSTAQTTQTSEDGSVGLFDGVLKKALFGGAIGAGIGFLPFIPGGPVLGGIVGALGGAAMGVFSNWQKQQKIKQENEAMLAAMGVQVDNPEIQQVLQSGNVSQLIPMMEEAQGGSTVQQGAGSTVQQGTGVNQSVVPTQGTVLVGSGAGAINPSAGVDPGVAPANQGGGGSAGDAGRPVAPTGVNSSDVSAVAPDQPGVGATDAAEGAEQVAVNPQDATLEQLNVMIEQLQQQIDMLKAMIAEDERRRAETLAAEERKLAAAV